MSYKNIPLGKPEQFNAVVEISKGGENKYEYDENLDSIKLDWVFSGGFHFPFDYGYIPQTRGGDGDHLDVFIIASHPLPIGTIVECRPVGMIELLDRGEEDNKILAVPVADLKYANCKGLEDLDFDYESVFREFCRELGVQKDKVVEIKGFRDQAAAIKAIEFGHNKF